MSHTNRNFVIAYVLLVGLPLAGLAGVLKSGHSIKAPVAIDGTWNVDSTSLHTAGQSCDKAVSALAASSFLISQSGRNLTLTLQNANKTSGDGSLDGTSLNVPLAVTDSQMPACAAGQALVLTGTIQADTDRRSMSGLMWVADCPACATMRFHAVRQARTQGGGH